MKNILEYLEHTAAAFPQKTGVEDQNGSLTFAKLLELSQRAGSSLPENLALGQPVAVFLEKGIPALTAFFATVYGGGFYALMNPSLPPVRIRQMQSVLQAEWVITSRDRLDAARQFFPAASLLLIEELSSGEIRQERLDSVRRSMNSDAPLYAMFTSGSTGTPKAVVVSHQAVLEFLEDFTGLFSIGPEDILGNQAPFDFDVSVKDIYSCLKTGATLSILPKELFSRPQQLLDWLCDHRVTTLIWAVSALCLVSAFHGLEYRQPRDVKRVLFSGEEMPYKHLMAWKRCLPQAQFANLYGPTEITCNCAYHLLQEDRDYRNGIPIGRAFPHRQVFLLDPDGREVTAPGDVGEICVGGSSLALGYYHAPDQTAAVFVENPLLPGSSQRIYRTGDLGRYGDHGELYFCGRKDFQIKYLGHRIELEEIQRAAANLSGVERCCCVFHQEKHRLYGFYSGALSPKELHRQLVELLPSYMVPSVLYKVDQFPLTKNGKIHRQQLLERRDDYER